LNYLLDTDVLSITSPASRLAGDAVDDWRRWVRNNTDRINLSAITLMELRFGVENLRAKRHLRKADALSKWLLISETLYRDRIVWISPEIADRAGQMLSIAAARGHKPGAEDALIAASAHVGGMMLISRNLRHMRALGADCLDPLGALPLEEG
jgi:predicted nucleic acid-binding protein